MPAGQNEMLVVKSQFARAVLSIHQHILKALDLRLPDSGHRAGSSSLLEQSVTASFQNSWPTRQGAWLLRVSRSGEQPDAGYAINAGPEPRPW